MHRKILKVILLGATLETGNMGVSALTMGAITCIVHKYPEAEILLLDYGKDNSTYNVRILGREISVHTLNMRFSKKFYLKNNIAILILISLLLKLVPSKSIKKFIILKNYYLRNIYEADIIASIAGGDSFSDIYGIGRFLYVSLPQLLVLLVGKNLILLPQTLGPFKSGIVKVITRFIINHSSFIYSRDYDGLNEIKGWQGITRKEKLKLCYDVGFVVDPIPPVHLNLVDFLLNKKSYSSVIGLNVSGLLYKGGYTGDNMFGLMIDYRNFIHNLINYLIEEKRAIVLLVPHVFGSGEDSESDSAICKRIYNKLKPIYDDSLFLAHGTYNQSEIKYIIGLCDFFIGSRMHACIAALSQCIPAIGIAYSNKFKGVFETIESGHLVAEPRTMDETEILAVIDRNYEDRQMQRERLQKLIPQVKATILNIFKEIIIGLDKHI